MAGEVIKVTPSRLRSTASNIQQLAGDYQKLYGSVYQEVEAMQKFWDAEDNKKYASKIAQFRDDFEDMYKEMKKYWEHLEEAAGSYERTQQNVINEADRLRTDY